MEFPLPPAGGEGEGGEVPSASEVSQHTIPLLHWFTLDRRGFLRLFGGGLLVVVAAPEAAAFAQESGRGARDAHELPRDLSAWLSIDAEGRVTVFTGKVEMGQNIRTSLTQLVAEELRVGLSSIRLVMGDTDLVPWDAGTFGSRTTPTMGPQMLLVAATARETLIDMAASRWKVRRDELSAANGRVADPGSNRVLSYGEITRGEKLVKTIPADAASVPLLSPERWAIAGARVPKVDGRSFVTGSHEYPSDVKRPGMLYGKVLRPVAFEATLVSLDTGKAAAMPGVRVVRDGDFAGVVAPDLDTAEKAVAALASGARWKETPGQPSNATIFDYFRKNAGAGAERGSEPEVKGSMDDGLASADVKLSQSYTVQYIAHAPLEPRAAVAEWSPAGDRLTVWTGTQRPFAVRDELARGAQGPDRERAGPDARHRLRLRRQAHRRRGGRGRAPRQGRRQARQGRLDARGRVHVGLPAPGRPDRGQERREARTARSSHGSFTTTTPVPPACGTPYDVANQKIQFHPVEVAAAPGLVPRRSPRRPTTSPARSHMDELAHELGMDPLAFRLKNLSDAAAAAPCSRRRRKSSDGRNGKAAPGRGFGIAGGHEKGGYIAICAEVESRSPRTASGSAGWPPRSSAARSSTPTACATRSKGAIIQGIGGALFEAIRFENGRLLNPHFAQYRVPRFTDVPPIEIVLLDRKDLPAAGAGESPIVAIAPAVASGIFEATGERRRAMPLEGLPDSPSPPSGGRGQG